MVVFLIFLLTAMGVYIQPTNIEDLRKDLENPVAPIQVYTMDFTNHENSGPYNRSQNILGLHARFYDEHDYGNWIHRVTLPLMEQPEVDKNASLTGFGNMEYKVYLASSSKEKWVWGGGPVLSLPTGDTRFIEDNNLAGGLGVIVLYQYSIATLGGELTQIWSSETNLMKVDPVVKARVGKKTTIGFLDTITVDWNKDKENRWTIPTGVEVGQLFRASEAMPVMVTIGAFGNVVRPDNTSDWYWRLKVDFLMSK